MGSGISYEICSILHKYITKKRFFSPAECWEGGIFFKIDCDLQLPNFAKKGRVGCTDLKF